MSTSKIITALSVLIFSFSLSTFAQSQKIDPSYIGEKNGKVVASNDHATHKVMVMSNLVSVNGKVMIPAHFQKDMRLTVLDGSGSLVISTQISGRMFLMPLSTQALSGSTMTYILEDASSIIGSGILTIK